MTTTKLEALSRYDGDTPQSSYSALTLHRKCPQAWLYRYGMRLEQAQDETGPYLIIGRWWSVLQAAEALERGRAAQSLLFVPRKLDDKAEGYAFDPQTVVVEDVIAAAHARWKRMKSEAKAEFEAALGGTLPERLENMFSIWDKANPNRFEREHPLGVEVFWKRELPQPENDAAWDLIGDRSAVPAMRLIGYIDELYWDTKRGMVVIKDGKAQKDIDRGNSALDDLMDSQLQLYAWGIAPKLKREGLPGPRAISYDRVRSVGPKSPLLTAAGGLSKSVTAYDLDTYVRWASTDGRPGPEEVAAMEEANGFAEGGLQKVLDRMDPGPVWGKVGEFYVSGAKKGLPKFGTYTIDPKVVENLGGITEVGRWSDRSYDPVNRRMIAAHLRSAVDTALDIFQTQKRAEVVGHAARNLDRRGCSFCDYRDLCRAQLVGGPDGDYDIEAFGLRQKPKKTHSSKEKSA